MTPNTSSGSNRSAGFSLLEMLIALSIFATISALAFQYIKPPNAEDRLQEIAENISRFLIAARVEAINRGEIVKVKFNTNSLKLSSELRNRSVSLEELTFLEITSAHEAGDYEGNYEIWFFPDGSSTGGVVKLSIGTAKSSIKVSWLTGFLQNVPQQ